MKYLLVSVLMILGFSIYEQSHKVILETDFEGNVINGSIDNLIKKIREGKPVRVGWQLDFDGDKISDLEHWVDAEFISISGGHVFTQIRPIYTQGRNKAKEVKIGKSKNEWNALIGTTGELKHRVVFEFVPDFVIDDSMSDEIKQKILESKEKVEKKMNISIDKVATFWSVAE